MEGLWLFVFECICALRTINLQGVRLEKLLISVSVAGVVAHVCGGNLGDVQWAIISKILQTTRKPPSAWPYTERLWQTTTDSSTELENVKVH